VDCETCNALLAEYRHAVGVFKDAVQNGAGATGPDSQLAGEEVVRFSKACQDAGDALIEHWRTDHRGLAAKSGS
jgi:hypothetical protein